MSSFPSLFPAGFCAAVKCMLLSDSYLTCLSVIKSFMCHFPLCETYCIKSSLSLSEEFTLSVSLSPSLIHLQGGGGSKTNKKPPLSENQHKYRTFEMPKDSRTHRLLDNSLQATITPQSISPTPSLSLSPQPLCLFASLPSSQESSHLSTPHSYCTRIRN